MGGGDHCVVQNCSNDRRYPEKYIIKDHIKLFNGSLQLKFWRCKDVKMLPKWNSKIRLFRSNFRISLRSPVCSNHFKMGRPTDVYTYPTEYLNGYDIKLKKRKSPLKRISIIRKKKYVADYQSSHDQNEDNHDQIEFTEPINIHYDHDYALPVGKDFLVSETNDVEDLQIFIKTPKRLLKRPLLIKHRKHLLSKFSLKSQAEFSWDRVCHSDSILTTWITYFGNELKPLLLWPTQEANLLYKARHFSGKLHNVEGIIDCTEQKIQRPSNAKAQYQTFSIYKSSNTLKKLVVTTKTGSFSFISKAYGGQASDRHITEDCNVINMFSEGSMCLADRVVLVCPPLKKKGQHFTQAKIQSAKEIAQTRVHVERSIRRLKEFRICKNELSLTMLDLIDHIYVICGALSNIQPPIVKEFI
ncbi:uncharacterized protein LOC136082739 [Hydra vulgaris]|uniref:Uncharacterized protein LOC136082739 n=1 Tax=Hydra vulgaris TaxID=6087 RepID=A0ABM4C995_HYDVU